MVLYFYIVDIEHDIVVGCDVKETISMFNVILKLYQNSNECNQLKIFICIKILCCNGL